MKKITNMLKDVVTKAQEAKNSGMSAQVMPDSGVPMEEGEVNITSRPSAPRSRGGFSGVINKARDAIQAAQASKKPFKSGGSVKSGASKRGDGCATKGKTKGRMI
jgi:hypothetical protein